MTTWGKQAIGLWIGLVGSFALSAQTHERSSPGSSAIAMKTVDSVVRRLMDTAGVTGLSVGVIHAGEVQGVRAYGYGYKDQGKLNDTSTFFYAASLAKPLFAFLVMQLVDEGTLDLDRPLHEYLPQPLPTYREYQDLQDDDRWKSITARHCLDHTTGFPNWRQLNPDGSQKLKIFFTPGSRYAYSGEGMYLLQFVVEKITGQTLEELAQQKVFKPFGMGNSSFVWQERFESRHAAGHDHDENVLTIIRREEANAAGSMVTTIADYTRFFSAFLKGRGVTAQSRQEMLSPQIRIVSERQFPTLASDTTDRYASISLSYGLGWGLFDTPKGPAFFKEGHSDDGWEHYTIGFPDSGDGLVILSNSLNGESIYKELVECLTGITIPWEWEGYIPYRPTIRVAEATLRKYVGHYTGALAVNISLENGQLKVEAPAEGLPKTNLYPTTETRYFIKSMPLDVEFVEVSDGSVIKLIVSAGDERYELTKG